MFGSIPNSRGSSSTSGQHLTPMRFVWPYGGRRVFLSGSFTRWTEHVPMSPMEGCPTVFQVICNLTPGYHQYKFFVDGEWRHDEHQLIVNGNGGVVNAIFIGGGQDMIPTGFSQETLGRANMELDEVFVRMSDTSQESIPRMSETDLEVSRHRISVFLSTHTAEDLVPHLSLMSILDVDLAVKQAFHILYELGIPLAPLWDSRRGEIVGILGPLDFILILRELGTHGSNLTEEELETHTIAAWKEGKSHINRQIDGTGAPYPRPLVQAGAHENLKDIVLKLLQNKVATIPIMHSSASDGYEQIAHLASLSDILKCICRYFRHSSSSLPILQQPICSMPLGTWVPRIGESSSRHLATLRPHASLGSALLLLVQAEVSSIPIVDDNDSLIDIYSRSDITALAKDSVYAQIHLDNMTIQQALQLGQDANPPYGFFNGQRCHMCLRTDSLHKVMERLANPGVRRVVIVEAGSKRVEGIISLSDVFRFLLGV